MLIQRILATPGSPSVPIMSESFIVPSKEVRLAPSARDRFERLGDRLKLLMLNTIHECLEEQKSLSDTVRRPLHMSRPRGLETNQNPVFQPHEPKGLAGDSKTDPERYHVGQNERLFLAH